MNEIQRAHAITWAYRQRLAHVWPTPPEYDAYAFAATEGAGEVLDAKLRENPAYSRNSERNPDLHDELADTAMMLCTGLGPDWVPSGKFRIRHYYGHDRILAVIAHCCTGALVWCGTERAADEAEEALMLIAYYPGMGNLAERVEQRLQRIERRVSNARWLEMADGDPRHIANISRHVTLLVYPPAPHENSWAYHVRLGGAPVASGAGVDADEAKRAAVDAARTWVVRWAQEHIDALMVLASEG